jgi:DNA invertase Pin-like site-specific DNA recombinase
MTEQRSSRKAALEAAKSRPTGSPRKRPEAQSGRPVAIAFSYLRVSTKEQARVGGGAEGYSIPAQRDACQKKATQLEAIVEREYVDAGESARSAHREQLQQMLQDIKTVKPDYVIVHKIDRLARNREDDIAINLMLRKHGVKLISCTENIDETPQGKLLYGLLAEIAQFYSGNLAQEVMKGLLRKAEEGGTPFRAPLGYINRRETTFGVERSWVELDPDRADIIRWCFEQYATGEWSALDLTLAAQAKGLTSRPTAKRPAAPVGDTTMYHILANPYYIGVVRYQGIHYEGKHPPLVEPDVWLAVQDVLAAHNHTGEKDRVHNHYLRSTIYCSSCGGRLVFSQNTGRGGTYQYFMCVKRKTKRNNCTRPAVRVERIEDGIANHYGAFQVQPDHAEQIRATVHQELNAQQQDADRNIKRAQKRKQQAQDERQKLLQAHYAGAVPQDLLATEMNRLTRELAEANTEITVAKTATRDIDTTLTAALQAASRCQAAYLIAPNHIRRQINQGFFKKLFIGEDGEVERAELTEPFAALLGTGKVFAMQTTTAPDEHASASQIVVHAPDATEDRTRPSSVFNATYGDQAAVTESKQNTTHRTLICTMRGVKQNYLVGRVGLEPTAKGL